MLSAAVDDELLIAHPVFGFARKLGRRPDAHEEPRAMTAEQLERFLRLAAQSDRRHYPLFLSLARTGLRIGEGLGLKQSDCDLLAREIRVRRPLTVGRWSMPRARMGRDRGGPEGTAASVPGKPSAQA